MHSSNVTAGREPEGKIPADNLMRSGPCDPDSPQSSESKKWRSIRKSAGGCARVNLNEQAIHVQLLSVVQEGRGGRLQCVSSL
eukprot:989879-Amphidinium_carterae.1